MVKIQNFLLTFKKEKVVMLNSVQHLIFSKRLDPEIEDPELDSGHGSG
jgi:hypothetical protein